MNHQDIQDTLFDLESPEGLNPLVRDEVLAHLGQCSDCRDRQARWAAMSQAYLNGLPLHRSAQASEALVERVMTRLSDRYEKAPDLQWSVFTRWAFPLLGVAAAAVILAVRTPVSTLSESYEPFSVESTVHAGASDAVPFSTERSDDL